MDLKNINLMNDALFKAFMCHQNNRELVVDFLHSVTKIDKEVLRRGEFIGGEEIPKRRIGIKKQMTDFNIKLENKQRIIIEMNQRKDESVFNKNDLYAFTVVVELSHKNMKEYPKVILINIDNFNAYQTDKPLLTFKIRDEEGHIESEMYESIHLVLANIIKPKYNIDKEIKKFARFLKERDLEKLAEEFRGEEKYMAAIRTVEDLTMDENLIGYYDYEEAKEREKLELKWKEEEIREKSLKEGLQEGIKEGIKKANIEIAKNLLKENIPISTIVKSVNLSKKEILELENL